MPLFSKKLLQETVAKHKHEIASTAKQGLKDLFQETLGRIESGKFGKEESEKVPFLQRLFELLGYKLHENLEFEYSSSGRSIDGVLGYSEPDDSPLERGKNHRNVEVAIEWKGVDTKNLDLGKAGETPVSQMWDYMGKVGAEIGIVGNFLEFRIYTLKTKQTEFQQYFLRELSENEDKLDEFIFVLKKQNLLYPPAPLKGGERKRQPLLLDLINKSEAEQEQITKRFYNDYKQRRLNLFEHLVENNSVEEPLRFQGENGMTSIPLLNHKIFLLEKAQKILDRLIFIMFCEDGFLLPNGILKSTFNLGKSNRSRSETKIWEQFQYLFEDIGKGRYDVNPQINAFNGGLFAEDLELNNLIIKDEIWADLIKLTEYDFQSDLNVNILGHIFEQSISDIEEIKNEIENTPALSERPFERGKIERNVSLSKEISKGQRVSKKTSKRKKDGIYYTPEYITDYIVSETVGGWLEDQENFLSFKIDGQKTPNSPSLKGWQAKPDGVVSRNTEQYLSLPFNPKLKEKARRLRKAGNLSEALLWNKIKQRNLLGLDFDRQKIIGNYIVDFYSPNLNLIIEIDGESHDLKGEYDQVRENYLKNLGLNIVHFEDNRIKQDLDGVMQELWGLCDSFLSKTTPPAVAGTPSGKGNYSAENIDYSSGKGNYSTNSLETIKILDPAGGSGAFPNQVHSYLAKKHVEQIKDRAQKDGFDPSLVDIDEKVIDKSILKNNIFMVDLQPESVEIAKLSLWLKTAKKDQKLNNLDENLKCGNSLIDDPEIAGDLAFDWGKEFSWLKNDD